MFAVRVVARAARRGPVGGHACVILRGVRPVVPRSVAALSTTPSFAGPKRHRSSGNGWAVAGAAAAVAAAATATVSVAFSDNGKQHERTASTALYTRAEVAKHKTAESRIWVTYKTGVYDITEFVEAHPGGAARIMLAAGGAVDPFWQMYQQHNRANVLEILAQYKIGELQPGEDHPVVDASDPYSGDPARSPALRVLQQKPFNAETLTELIPDNYITPNSLHYVRHHHPVPDVKPEDHTVTVVCQGKGDEVVAERQYTLAELREKFPEIRTTVTLQCAGNRRKEYAAFGKVQGLDWLAGAASTAEYVGVRLSDVLRDIGVEHGSNAVKDNGIAHVQFEALDKPYDASIPLAKAVSPDGDVLLALEMNGEPIPRDHGGPLRMVVPGHVAARSVKWLGKIVASPYESGSTWQRGVAYRGFSPNVTSFKGVDPDTSLSVQELPVQSVICSPFAGEEVVAGDTVTVRGWAWSGGGRNIVRVDVTTDGGTTWHTATLGQGSQQPLGRAWAWTLWEAEVPVPAAAADGDQQLRIAARAVDASYNSQPEKSANIWNLRGILNNSWHVVQLSVVD